MTGERFGRGLTRRELLGIAARRDGVRACEGAFECSRTCPQRLAPGRSIRELKTLIAERNDQ